MSSSANADTANEWGSRVLRGVNTPLQHAPLSQQLEACAPGDPMAVDPRLRERSMEEGRRAGFSQGYEDGMANAQMQLAQMKSAIEALRKASDDFTKQEIDFLAVAEDEILDAVFAIAHAVLQHEVSLQQDSGREAIKRALAMAPNGNEAVAYLNPHDADQLETDEIKSEGRLIRIVPNTSVEKGGCILEVGPTRIDSQLVTALQRMRAVL